MELLLGGWGPPIAGAAVGVVMGYAARANHFCIMASLERHWYAGDSTGIRSWVLAAAVALIATQAGVAAGLIDLGESFYITSPLPIAGAILGGLMFGLGMALVGTCGFGSLIWLGGGNLRALVVLTGIALAAIAAQRGVTAHFRAALIDPASIDLTAAGGQSLPALFVRYSGIDVALPMALALGLAAIWWCARDSRFRRNRGAAIAGVVLGLCVATGWLITTHYSRIMFAPVQIEAASFVAPLGDAMLQIITVTGALPDYGVGLAVGVFLGAALAAWRADDMRWEACDDARELSRHLVGAFLMGTGGVFALGCTIGQGVSAVSAMAVSAPLAIASMVIGARIGLSHLVEGNALEFLFGRRRADPAE